MDATRSKGSNERSVSPRERTLDPEVQEERRGQQRDEERPRPPSEEPATGESRRQDRSEVEDDTDPDQIEENIRRTRARMSETIDEIEYRLSPDHMKREAKDFLYERVDEVRAKVHPTRLAKQAGSKMKNTVKEHPVPSIIAGLSIGYLVMKSREDPSAPPVRSRYAPRSARPIREERSSSEWGERQRPVARRARREASREQRHREGGDAGFQEQMQAASEQVAEKAEDVKEGATRQAQEATEQAEEWAEEVGRRTRSAGASVKRGARSAQHRMERGARETQREVRDFVNRNPLMAGALALGAGAFIGGMFPSTRTEDEWMGEARDEVMHRAGEATEETMDRAREAAENIGDEAKSAAQDVVETTKEKATKEAEKEKKEEKEERKNVGEKKMGVDKGDANNSSKQSDTHH